MTRSCDQILFCIYNTVNLMNWRKGEGRERVREIEGEERERERRERESGGGREGGKNREEEN